ncbi:ATP-binding cassette sub-family A member 2-like [Glandiceps talaboti]
MESVQSNRGRPQRSHTANGYWSHLKLLLWKNYTVKKRQPVTVICEILAPLVVFLIIIGVRSNQLGFPVTTEYNQAMPLPSAGWIPMLQFFCPEVSSDQYGFPDYENTRVSEILEFLSTSSDEHSTLNLHNIQQMMSSLEKSNENETQQIPESLNNASSPVKTFLSNPFIQLMLKQVFTSFTAKAKPHLKQFLEMTKELDSLIPVSDSCDLYPNVTGRNLTDQDREDGNPEPSQDEYIVVDPDTDFKVPKQRTILFVKLWNSLQSVMCGINNTVNETVFNDPDWIHKMGFTDTQLVKFKLMAFLLLRGRPVILYAPNTTDVNQVIEKANETMKALDSITKSSEILFNVSVELTELLQQNVTQELYQTDDNSQSSLYDSGVGWLRDLLMIGDREDLQQMADSLAKVTCIWNSLMSKVNLNLFQPFVDEKSMARYSAEADRSDNITVIAGLVFETNTEGQLPAHVTYKVKLNGTYAPYTYFIQQKIPLQYHEHDYSLEHLLFPFVQDVVERAIIEQKVGKTVIEPGGYIREFPYACHVQDYFQYKVGHSLVVFLTFIWIYYILTITQTVVHEKEDRLKEMMKIMGLSNFIYWLSWFLTNLIQMSVTVTLLVVILKYGQIYQYSNLFLLWVFTMLFAVSSILLCFFLSVFFSKARIAASSSGIIYFLTTLPYFYIQNLENASHLTITLPYKILSCLPSPSAYGLGMRYILMHELQMVGLQWSTINAPWPEYNQDLSVCQVMLFMVFDCFIYVLLMWYIEAVYPGSYGVPQPWYFPFLKSYWCDCQSVDVTDGQDSDLSSLYRQDGCVRLNDILATEDPDSQIEDEPRNQDIGVHINRLVKVYDTGKVKAVNGLSLNLYEDQITALLGHNGAGKTTIMSILTGFITPTSGTAIINGKDIRREMVQIRQSLGICPQYNALFDKLTVQEHLWFYGRLKGVDMKNYKAELQGLLKDVGLRNKKHNTIKTLSGGMKRKLSIAVAFTGGAKTVILDEPTAGVDPYARRAIWDLLQKYKQGRTILLSTHHMDEASLLGDRIAILAKGQLKCCGSSQYLKTNLGDGYKLTIVKEKEMRELVDEDVDSICQEEPKPWSTFSSSKVTLLIQDYIPSAESRPL